MAAKKKGNRFAVLLAEETKAISKAKPNKLHPPLFRSFVVFAAAGDIKRAGIILDWMYSRVPASADIASATSTQAMDGFCLAANLGDRTRGLPRRFPLLPGRAGLQERVADGETWMRQRLTGNAYGGPPPTDDAWEQKAATDPWRRIDQWRRIQRLVAEGQEPDALNRLFRYLDDLPADARGSGYGHELVLALDLALRNGANERVGPLLDTHGHRFANESFLIEEALCLPAVAHAIASGALGNIIGLSEADREGALAALDGAIDASLGAKPKAVPKIQRRRVTCEYSQVHLEPITLDRVEAEQVYFQEKADSARGMSLFPTKVGIATPTETDYVDAEVSLSGSAPGAKDMDGVVQAVAFPLIVRGPIQLRSVAAGDDEEPLTVPPASYDVLARFFARRAPAASTAAGLRVFKLVITFHPEGSLEAPRTIRLQT